MPRSCDGHLNILALSCLLALPITLSTAAAADQDVSSSPQARAKITYFEPFLVSSVTVDRRLAIAAATSNSQRRLDVSAFQESYRLELEANTRMQAAALDADNVSSLQLLSGSISGKQGSWVRLSFAGADAEGLIWDGKDLYAVEPASAVAEFIAAPLSAPESGNVIFRLADTEIDLGSGYCGSALDFAAASDGLETYEALAGELKRMQIAALSATPTQGIEISALGDASFRNQYASTAEAQDAMLIRLNNVDGIFSAQTGVRIQAPSATAYDSDPTQLSTTTDASSLLQSLASLRANTASLRSRGLTHLFTGRPLDGSTVGVAYIGSLCDAQYGVALTESRFRGAWLDSLIAAHEIGHNLGAIHDGESVCASTPLTYLMAPQLTGSSAFSQCSLDKILPKLQTAACLVVVATPDPAMPSALSLPTAAPGASFTWSFPVSNAGGADAQNVTVQISLPEGLVVEQRLADGGSCAEASGSIVCSIDTIATGGSRTVTLTLHANTTGTFDIGAQLSAAADSNLSNNSASGSLLIQPMADLSVSLSLPGTVNYNGNADATFKLTNLGGSDAQSISLTLTVPDGLTLQTVTLGDASCTVQAQQAVCTLASLPTNEAVNGQMRLGGAAEGGKQVKLTVSEQTYDPIAGNNDASGTLQVVAAVAVTTSEHSGGGGGEFDIDIVAALAALEMSRRLRQRRDTESAKEN